MKKKLVALTLAAAMVLGLAACGSSAASEAPAAEPAAESTEEAEAPAEEEAEAPAEEEAEAPAESSTGRTDVIVNLGEEPATLDPTMSGDGGSYSVENNIYEGLVRIGDELEIIPALAETWDFSEDGTVITFHLRQGVTFQNGDPFTAADVVYTFDRALSGGFAGSVADIIKEYKAVDDNTFELTLNYAYGPAIELVGCYWFKVINKNVVEEQGEDFSFNPVGAGTGPYEFVEWNTGSNMILKAYDNYWGGKARIETVDLRFISDITTAVTALEAHDIDYASINTTDIEYFEQHSDELTYFVSPSIILNYIGFNCQDEYFKDARIRQAVSLCIDREEMLLVAQDSPKGGALTATDVPITGFGSNQELQLPQVDLEKAKALLAEAGYPDGFKTQMYCANQTGRKKMATYMQSQLAQIGIEAEIIPEEQSAVLDDMAAGKCPIFFMGYSGTSGDADFFLYPMHHSGQTFNYFNYSNDELDAKLEKARASVDPDERIALYAEIQQEIYDQVPVMPMFFVAWKRGCDANLAATSGALQVIYIYDWYWK